MTRRGRATAHEDARHRPRHPSDGGCQRGAAGATRGQRAPAPPSSAVCGYCITHTHTHTHTQSYPCVCARARVCVCIHDTRPYRVRCRLELRSGGGAAHEAGRKLVRRIAQVPPVLAGCRRQPNRSKPRSDGTSPCGCGGLQFQPSAAPGADVAGFGSTHGNCVVHYTPRLTSYIGPAVRPQHELHWPNSSREYFIVPEKCMCDNVQR